MHFMSHTVRAAGAQSALRGRLPGTAMQRNGQVRKLLLSQVASGVPLSEFSAPSLHGQLGPVSSAAHTAGKPHTVGIGRGPEARSRSLGGQPRPPAGAKRPVVASLSWPTRSASSITLTFWACSVSGPPRQLAQEPVNSAVTFCMLITLVRHDCGSSYGLCSLHGPAWVFGGRFAVRCGAPEDCQRTKSSLSAPRALPSTFFRQAARGLRVHRVL